MSKETTLAINEGAELALRDFETIQKRIKNNLKMVAWCSMIKMIADSYLDSMRKEHGFTISGIENAINKTYLLDTTMKEAKERIKKGKERMKND